MRRIAGKLLEGMKAGAQYGANAAETGAANVARFGIGSTLGLMAVLSAEGAVAGAEKDKNRGQTDGIIGKTYGEAVAGMVPKTDWKEVCQMNPSWSQQSTLFSIPDYSAGTTPQEISMPIANLLYDSTNSAPKSNAQADWGTTSWTGIMPAMEGVKTFNYMLVPQTFNLSPSTSTTAPSYSNVSFYPKEYAPPWLEDFGDESYNLNLQTPPEPASMNKNIPLQMLQDSPIGIISNSDNVACINTDRILYHTTTPNSIEVYGNSTCDEPYVSYVSNTAPPAPIPVLNQKVMQQCATVPPTECNPAQQNTSMQNLCDVFSTEQMCNQETLCKWSTPSPTSDPTCTVKTPLTTPKPSDAKGVCYDPSVNLQGMPAVRACLAVPKTKSPGTAIPPFDAQRACLGHLSQEACNNDSLEDGLSRTISNSAAYVLSQEYTCSWQMVETQDTCAQYTSKGEQGCIKVKTPDNNTSCAWDPCNWSNPGEDTGVCESSPASTTVLNAQVDPLVWTIHNNFKHSTAQPLACTPDGADCNLDVNIPAQYKASAPAPFANPEICSSQHKASQRHTVPGTDLNGIPFCARYG